MPRQHRASGNERATNLDATDAPSTGEREHQRAGLIFDNDHLRVVNP